MNNGLLVHLSLKTMPDLLFSFPPRGPVNRGYIVLYLYFDDYEPIISNFKIEKYIS